MVIVLPLLLMTTSVQRLAGLPLSVSAPGAALPPLPPGPVERLDISPEAGGWRIIADVRTTDVLASSGDVERRELFADDLLALQGVLRTLKTLDQRRTRATLMPGPDTRTDLVVAWMDAVQADNQGELFPDIILQSPGTP